MNRGRLAWLLAVFAAEHPERPLWSVTAVEFALWARERGHA
jgi:hypothetical protein